ncbi:hypothetical protein EB796_024609 [Bugula neritina]|uniref:Uncharacterized protein n=1 Tax=Bugula neritina TaxID=10212 RepID=A0A7J7IV32_BUGNE|nr:hypothetical protein EB796_024609 [Bugula neritina]
MKSEISQLTTKRQSLMSMLALNEDFAYSISPLGRGSKSSFTPSRAATTNLIDGQRYDSVMNKYAEVMRNRGLHDCEKLSTHCRKHEYKKWDYSHADRAKYSQQKNMMATVTRKLPESNVLEKKDSGEDGNFSDESSEIEIKDLIETKATQMTAANCSRMRTRTGRTTLTRMTRPPSQDDEENIPETERIQMTVDKIKKGRKGDLLAEIQLIKDRHKQLDVLTQAKRRAEMENKKIRQSPKISEAKRQENLLKKFLLANTNLQKELDFNKFKERTTIDINRDFTDTVTNLQEPGIIWAPKWSVSRSHLPGKISKSIHPVSDARKNSVVAFKPAKPGDLPPCIYLPKHIDKKIPVESAWLLDKFMKETLDMASSGKPVGVLPLGMSPQLHE